MKPVSAWCCSLVVLVSVALGRSEATTHDLPWHHGATDRELSQFDWRPGSSIGHSTVVKRLWHMTARDHEPRGGVRAHSLGGAATALVEVEERVHDDADGTEDKDDPYRIRDDPVVYGAADQFDVRGEDSPYGVPYALLDDDEDCTPGSAPEPKGKLDVLGSGYFGTAYLVEKEDGTKSVVKRVVWPNNIGGRSPEQECDIAKELHKQDSDHFFNCKDFKKIGKFCDREGTVYTIEVDYIKGQNLEDRWGKMVDDKNVTVTDAELTAAAKDLLAALSSLQAKGYAHTDIKPANVMYNEETSKYMLVDYGIVRKCPENFEIWCGDEKDRVVCQGDGSWSDAYYLWKRGEIPGSCRPNDAYMTGRTLLAALLGSKKVQEMGTSYLEQYNCLPIRESPPLWEELAVIFNTTTILAESNPTVTMVVDGQSHDLVHRFVLGAANRELLTGLLNWEPDARTAFLESKLIPVELSELDTADKLREAAPLDPIFSQLARFSGLLGQLRTSLGGLMRRGDVSQESIPKRSFRNRG